MMGKIIIGYQDTPQGLDALALGEITSEEQATLMWSAPATAVRSDGCSRGAPARHRCRSDEPEPLMAIGVWYGAVGRSSSTWSWPFVRSH